jgi:ankyrin repeat protein
LARNGGFPLRDAAANGDLPAVEILLAAGANPLLESGGRTALTAALLGGNPAVVRVLQRSAPALRLRDTLADRLAVWVARV